MSFKIICLRCGVEVTRPQRPRCANSFCSISCAAKFRGVLQSTRDASTQARIARLRITEQDRFWAKVRRGAAHECWEWTSYLTRNGYGRSSWRGKELLAHRIAMSLTDGLWESKLSVCHTCDNRSCCNPAHLWRGTYADNNRDMRAKGRQNDPRGAAVHTARLTEEQVIAIRQSDETHGAIAKHYGVSRGAIEHIKTRRSWRHIP